VPFPIAVEPGGALLKKVRDALASSLRSLPSIKQAGFLRVHFFAGK